MYATSMQPVHDDNYRTNNLLITSNNKKKHLNEWRHIAFNNKNK